VYRRWTACCPIPTGHLKITGGYTKTKTFHTIEGIYRVQRSDAGNFLRLPITGMEIHRICESQARTCHIPHNSISFTSPINQSERVAYLSNSLPVLSFHTHHKNATATSRANNNNTLKASPRAKQASGLNARREVLRKTPQ